MAAYHSQVTVPLFKVSASLCLHALELKSARVRVNRGPSFQPHRDWLAVLLPLYMPDDHTTSYNHCSTTMGIILLSRKLDKFVATVHVLANVSSIILCENEFTSGVGAIIPFDIEDLVVKNNEVSSFI